MVSWYKKLLCRSKEFVISSASTTFPHDSFSPDWVVIIVPKRAIHKPWFLWPLSNCLTHLSCWVFSSMGIYNCSSAQIWSTLHGITCFSQKVLKHVDHHNSIIKLLKLEGTCGDVYSNPSACCYKGFFIPGLGEYVLRLFLKTAEGMLVTDLCCVMYHL